MACENGVQTSDDFGSDSITSARSCMCVCVCMCVYWLGEGRREGVFFIKQDTIII